LTDVVLIEIRLAHRMISIITYLSPKIEVFLYLGWEIRQKLSTHQNATVADVDAVATIMFRPCAENKNAFRVMNFGLTAHSYIRIPDLFSHQALIEE